MNYYTDTQYSGWQTFYQSKSEESKKLYLYPDPDVKDLTKAVADELGVKSENVLMTNGSDEVLNFAFQAYCDENTPADNCVTVRDRDTMEQVRLPISELKSYIDKVVEF